MHAVPHGLICIGHGNGEASAFKNREVDPVITCIADLLFIEARFFQQMKESIQFIVASLVHVSDVELLCPPLDNFRLPASNQGQLNPATLQTSHAQAVTGRKSFHFVAAIIEIQLAIGQHAIDVQNQHSDQGGFFEQQRVEAALVNGYHQTTPACKRSWKLSAPTSCPSSSMTSKPWMEWACII